MSYFVNTRFLHLHKKLFLFLIGSSVFLLSASIQASPIYTALNVMRSNVDVAGIRFNPTISKIKIGYIFAPKVMFELQVSNSGESDSDNSLVKINDITAAYIRLASNPDTLFRIHVLLGYAETALQVTGDNSFDDVYGGYSWGVILESRVWSKSNFVSLEYNNFYYKNNVEISGISLGFKHVF